MAKEILAVPEHHLAEVIAVIRAGLDGVDDSSISDEIRTNLSDWCDEESVYLDDET